MKAFSRLCLAIVVVISAIVLQPGNGVLAASAPEVSLSVQNAAPRQVEDTTQRAVARDYAAAWQAMAEALDRNQVDLLNPNFAGAALEKLTATVGQQRQTGLHQRLIDKGHKVEAVFYSPEGSAMELQDTLQVQIQLLDGDKVIHSEDATIHYIALLTAAENSWKVRVLQAVPSF